MTAKAPKLLHVEDGAEKAWSRTYLALIIPNILGGVFFIINKQKRRKCLLDRSSK